MQSKDFYYKNHQAIFKEIKQAVPIVKGLGIWNSNDKKSLISEK